MISGYPGNGQFPENYLVVTVTTQSKGQEKVKRTGKAYWSGYRWTGVDGFKVSTMNSKVIKWEA